uniref:N-acetyltransferase domain-containing protein n=1 Tax=Glossina brevipalpis TaxID=37001 RepID=A0A1A9WCC4_9MUSC
MASNNDILIECDKGFLKSLLDILKKHLPREIRNYNTVYNYWYHYDKMNENRSNLKSDRWNFQFYRHRYGKMENCTVISISGLKDYIIGLFTLESTGAELMECIQETKLINWQNKLLEIMCNEDHLHIIREIARKKCNDWIVSSVENTMWISKETIDKLEFNITLPADVYIAPLNSEKHSQIITDHWYYKSENTLHLVKESIEFNGGLGIFRKNFDEQPICWLATNEFFTPGFLYTIESERRKGFAKFLLTAELKRLCNQHRLDMYSYVSIENISSLKLHEQLGFEIANRLIWLEKIIS